MRSKVSSEMRGFRPSQNPSVSITSSQPCVSCSFETPGNSPHFLPWWVSVIGVPNLSCRSVVNPCQKSARQPSTSKMIFKASLPVRNLRTSHTTSKTLKAPAVVSISPKSSHVHRGPRGRYALSPPSFRLVEPWIQLPSGRYALVGYHRSIALGLPLRRIITRHSSLQHQQKA